MQPRLWAQQKASRGMLACLHGLLRRSVCLVVYEHVYIHLYVYTRCAYTAVRQLDRAGSESARLEVR